MSWQVASFAILAAVLIGGFAWYERSRPTAQVLALVAALAALAVVGRIAFAALPNVAATTDIVVFAGYALGPAPGFAVGALAGLVTNFWLGQGPWTPWQMAGWGMCGLLGAALGLGVRNAGRLTLAAVCGFAAVAYGALMNFSLMATYGGDLTLERAAALQSSAVPFEVAHVVGNVAIALIAGPAMVRMLRRFRRRFEWRVPAVASGLIVMLALASASLPAGASAAAPDVDRAAVWLASEQNRDGGWGASPDRDSAPEMTAWSMLGLAAAGRNPLDVKRGGSSGVSYLRANVEELRSPGDLARSILALDAAGVDPRGFGGRNLVSDLLDRRRRNGSYKGWPATTAYAVIALRAAGTGKALPKSIGWLVKIQNDDGGWGDFVRGPSNADVTGAVMQAVPATEAARRARAFLRRSQRPSGGFPLGGNGSVNSQSTAWAAQGLIASGGNAGDARSYLAARQADDGHFRYSPSSDQTPIWVTGQALAAAAGEPYPISPPPRMPKPEPEGSGGGDPDAPSSDPAPNAGAGTSPEPPEPAPSGGSSPPPAGGLGGGSGLGPGAGPGVGPAGPRSGLAPPSAAAPLEGASPEPDRPPAAPPFEAGPNPGPKPWAPVGVGVGVGGLAIGGVLFVGRRFGW